MSVTKLISSNTHIKLAGEPEHAVPLSERYFSVLLGLQIVTLFFISPVVGKGADRGVVIGDFRDSINVS